jgi:hypothetical protein
VKSFMFEHEIRLEVLTPLLGWLIEIEHDWSQGFGGPGVGWSDSYAGHLLGGPQHLRWREHR